MRTFIRQLRPAFIAVLVFSAVLGIVYPAISTLVGQVAFGDKADGSLIVRDGTVIGSSLIGQAFTAPEYFHSRPSAAGAGYDGAASSGSNLGPTNPDLLNSIQERVDAYRLENGLADTVAVPVDAVTASGSGLDPHISIANAHLQAPRVAATRGLPVDQVLSMIDDNTDGRSLGVLGEPGVNVVMLNVALDDLLR